jgi:hypothetical protein
MFSFGPITARIRISCGEEFVIAFARGGFRTSNS